MCLPMTPGGTGQRGDEADLQRVGRAGGTRQQAGDESEEKGSSECAHGGLLRFRTNEFRRNGGGILSTSSNGWTDGGRAASRARRAPGRQTVRTFLASSGAAARGDVTRRRGTVRRVSTAGINISSPRRLQRRRRKAAKIFLRAPCDLEQDCARFSARGLRRRLAWVSRCSVGFRRASAPRTPSCCPARKPRALLGYLGLRPGQAHSREKLIALLWGDSPPSKPGTASARPLALRRPWPAAHRASAPRARRSPPTLAWSTSTSCASSSSRKRRRRRRSKRPRRSMAATFSKAWTCGRSRSRRGCSPSAPACASERWTR